jgi:hypothetical protein
MNQTLSVFSSVLTAFLAVMVAAFFCLLPQWSRPGMLFAVTVSAQFRRTREGRRILRDYRLQACVHALMSFALIYVGALTRHLIFLLAGVFWLPAGYFLIFEWARDRVAPYAEARSRSNESATEARWAQFSGGWLLHFGPFAVLGAAALFLHSRWQRMPVALFPFRGGFRGRPPGFILPTRETVYGPLVVAGIVCAALWIVSYIILRRAGARSSGGDRAEETDSLYRTLTLLLGCEYLLAVICSAASGLLPFMGIWVIVPLGALAMVALAGLFLLTADAQQEVLE